MSNLKDILSTSSFGKLDSVKKEIEEQYKKESERLRQEIFERVRPYRFTSRQELIDHVKAGNRLYEEDDNGYMWLDEETGLVCHYTMGYDPWSDMPTGMEVKHKTWSEFIKWTMWMDNESSLQNGTIPYWKKESNS